MEEATGQRKRTIQVKLGNQEAKSLTPNEAAEYLKSIAGFGAAGRDLHVQIGNLNINQKSKNPLPKKQPGMPCTEKEMKALMSMFVEIMGLQMNTERLNETKPPLNNLFQFPTDIPPPPGGWPEELTWPNTESLPPLSDTMDEDSSLEGLPALEEIPDEQKQSTTSSLHLTVLEDIEEAVTGLQGIAPFEWEALERVAVEEALEHEERTRKNIRRSKKEKMVSITNEATKKGEELNQAALQKAEELFQARKKAIVLWRNAVTATFQQVCQNSSTTSVAVLQETLDHSPLLQDYEKANPLEPHLKEFLPLLVKHRHNGKSARLCLAQFILRLRPQLLLKPLPTIGRSVLHVASWWGDFELVDVICQVFKTWKELREKGDKKKPEQVADKNMWPLDMKSSTMQLDEPCQESGWSPVHYAAIAGNLVVLEVLLQLGCQADTRTKPSHTWSKKTGEGMTARELVQCLLSNTNEVETLGTAWLDIAKEHKNQQKRYTTLLLNKVMARLEEVEGGKLSKRTLFDAQKEVDAIESQLQKEARRSKKDDVSSTNNSSNSDTKDSKPNKLEIKKEEASELESAPGKRTRKKKKKQPDDSGSSEGNKLSTVQSASSSTVQREDPVVTALIGMGFTREQVQAGINACGGHDRATVDNVVAWIFGQQDSGDNADPLSRQETKPQATKEDVWSSKQPKKKESKQVVNANADGKLAMKKEEQRRRNREWNDRQGLISKVPETKALYPANTTFPAGRETPTDSRKVVPPLPKRREEPTPLASTAANDVSNAAVNESSTVASSIEHRTIEIFNDDATISTLGSIATRSTIVPFNNAPPGFNVPPTMPEEPMASSWDQNTFDVGYRSNLGPPSAISESMVMQNLGLHQSPVTPNPPAGHRNPLVQPSFVNPHQPLLGGYAAHHDMGYRDSNPLVGGLNLAGSHLSDGRTTHQLSHHPMHHDRSGNGLFDPSHQHSLSQPPQYDPGFSGERAFVGSSNNCSNNELVSSLFSSSHESDPVIGLSGLVPPESNQFPIPTGFGLETLDREGPSLWDNHPLPLSADNSLSLFGLAKEENKRPSNWSGDGLGGSIW